MERYTQTIFIFNFFFLKKSLIRNLKIKLIANLIFLAFEFKKGLA